MAVTGMPGSGKSIISRVLAKALNARIYSMGDIVRREVTRRGLEVNVRNVEQVATELREELGKAAVAILLAREFKDEDTIIVDGLRSLDEVAVFSKYGRICLVAVHASPYTRYRRLMARGRVDEVKGWEDFMLRDRKNLEYGIGGAIAMADYMIVNEGSIEEVQSIAYRLAEVIRDEKGANCSGGGVTSYRERGEG